MPCTANVNMLEKVAGSIEASKGVFVIDYLGLSVKETQELRRALREVGAEMKVYKNNIVKIALKNAGQPDIEELLAGPCAYVFYEKDPVDAAKVIKEQAEKLKKMSFIGGIADGKALRRRGQGLRRSGFPRGAHGSAGLRHGQPALWHRPGLRRSCPRSRYRPQGRRRREGRCVVPTLLPNPHHTTLSGRNKLRPL